LLCGIGKGDAPLPEQRPGQLWEEMEEVELSLGLSLGSQFGLDKRGDKLPRLSFMAANGVAWQGEAIDPSGVA
jgi:hypothetical protein